MMGKSGKPDGSGVSWPIMQLGTIMEEKEKDVELSVK